MVGDSDHRLFALVNDDVVDSVDLVSQLPGYMSCMGTADYGPNLGQYFLDSFDDCLGDAVFRRGAGDPEDVGVFVADALDEFVDSEILRLAVYDLDVMTCFMPGLNLPL